MLEDASVVLGTYSALSTLKQFLEKLESKLYKKQSTIKNMKLEIGDMKGREFDYLLLTVCTLQNVASGI